jgi:2-oxoglutarate dehydrogenase E1 component
MKRDFRKPLILMTPKSLLRHKRCKSSLADLVEGTSFHRILPDDAETGHNETTTLVSDADIRRVIVCSGKVYYDLEDERAKRNLENVYLLRIEQLYPFPLKSLTALLGRFKSADVVWCQEEPRNMGAWTYVEPLLELALSKAGSKVSRAQYAGRPASAATATGQKSKHLSQFAAFMEQAFGI